MEPKLSTIEAENRRTRSGWYTREPLTNIPMDAMRRANGWMDSAIAIIALHQTAKNAGANAVTNIVSFYKSNE
jgi:hypothetical protein